VSGGRRYSMTSTKSDKSHSRQAGRLGTYKHRQPRTNAHTGYRSKKEKGKEKEKERETATTDSQPIFRPRTPNQSVNQPGTRIRNLVIQIVS